MVNRAEILENNKLDDVLKGLTEEQADFFNGYLREIQRQKFLSLSKEQQQNFWSKSDTIARINYLEASDYDRKLRDTKLNEKGQEKAQKVFDLFGGSISLKIKSVSTQIHKIFKSLISYRSKLVFLGFILFYANFYYSSVVKSLNTNFPQKHAIEHNLDDVISIKFAAALDNNGEVLDVTPRLMENVKSVGQYQAFIQSNIANPKAIVCDHFESLTESFLDSKTHSPATPRCKINDSEVWVASYVATGPAAVQPIFGVYHQHNGSWTYENFDLSDYNFKSILLPNTITTNEKKVYQPFINAFPEAKPDSNEE